MIGPLRTAKGPSGSTLFDEQAQPMPGTPSCTTPSMTKTRAEGLHRESYHRRTCNPYSAFSSDNMLRTPSNIPDISSRQWGKEPAHYASGRQTPSPSRSSYFYIQTMTSGCCCSLTLAKILLISWCWSQARIRERAETKARRQPPVDIHFSIVRPGTGGGSGMT